MMLNCTSALVNGLPSWNFTPSRNLKVIVLPSGLTVHEVARLGIGFRLKSYSSSPSYTLVATWPTGPEVLWYEASVGGSGCTIITSVPPRLGAAPCAHDWVRGRIGRSNDATSASKPPHPRFQKRLRQAAFISLPLFRSLRPQVHLHAD